MPRFDEMGFRPKGEKKGRKNYNIRSNDQIEQWVTFLKDKWEMDLGRTLDLVEVWRHALARAYHQESGQVARGGDVPFEPSERETAPPDESDSNRHEAAAQPKSRRKKKGN